MSESGLYVEFRLNQVSERITEVSLGRIFKGVITDVTQIFSVNLKSLSQV